MTFFPDGIPHRVDVYRDLGDRLGGLRDLLLPPPKLHRPNHGQPCPHPHPRDHQRIRPVGKSFRFNH